MSDSAFKRCRQFGHDDGVNASNDELLATDRAEAEAVLSCDMTKLECLWSESLIVNNPANSVIQRAELLELVRTEMIKYTSFERSVEASTVVDGIGIIMGQEVVTPAPGTPLAGKTVTRRFTNVWSSDRGVWKLAGRQATVIRVL